MENNSTEKLWFKRKRYGWGWTPSSFEGWLVLLVYLLGVFYILSSIEDRDYSNSETIINFVLSSVILTSLLIFVCYKKGEKPKWTWGDDK